MEGVKVMGIFFVLFFLLIRNCWVKASSWEPPGASVGELVVGVFLPRPQLSGGATRAAAERGSDWGIRSCLVGALPFLLHNALKGGVGGSPAHQRASLKDSMRHTLQGAVTAGSQPMCGSRSRPNHDGGRSHAAAIPSCVSAVPSPEWLVSATAREVFRQTDK